MYLFYGNAGMIPYIPNNFKVYNFNSFKEYGVPLNLFPPNNLGAISEYDFDCKYAEYIMMNDAVFMNFMNMIMDLYMGNNVFILVQYDDESFFNSDNSSWNTMLIESLFKFIQQRYGLNATLINSPEDISIAEEMSFTEFGICNMDIDKERFTYINEYNRIMMGGKPYE